MFPRSCAPASRASTADSVKPRLHSVTRRIRRSSASSSRRRHSDSLPVYRGEIISLLKSTSIVGYIAIQDLTKMSDIIRSRTYEAFFPLIATAIIYFILAWIISLILNLFCKQIDPETRRKRKEALQNEHDKDRASAQGISRTLRRSRT